MSLECLQEVIDHYEKLFENEKGYDVIIYAGENENVKEIRAHSLILCTRSQYFCAAFSNEWVKKENGKFIFKKPNISPQLFKIILRFIYCGKIDLKKLQVPEILKLLIVVDELNLQTLISHIQEYLIKNEENSLQQNFIEILETSYQHESLTNLWNFCIEKICEEPEILFDSADKFINLKEPLLELILKQDDLNLDEIDIWNSLLKWGLAQNPSISQDSAKWNEEEITIMKGTLHQFIPLIRFYHMSPEDFLDRIYPYPLKELLPKDSVSNLLTFCITPNIKPDINIHPPRQPKSSSTIIKPEHFALFANWINRKSHNVKKMPYKFQLLYRASRDGNTSKEFHNKCDNKGATITIAKIANSEHILGGYNPLCWDSLSNDWVYTKDSFIFSFTCRNDLQTAKVGYTNIHQYSIYCNKSYGPTFGGGFDLSFQYDNTTSSISNNFDKYYHKIDIPAGYKFHNYNANAFYVEDYEVFQVIEKSI